MSNSDLQRIISHVGKHAQRYYPEFVLARAQVRLVREEQRSASMLYHLDLCSRQLTRPVLVKKPPVDGEPVRVSKQTIPAIKFRSEYEALVAIYNGFEGLKDPRLAAVRPLDFIPDQLAIVMERVQYPNLRQLLVKASRIQPRSSRTKLNLIFRNAGYWLRAFHGLAGREHVEIEHAHRNDFTQLINRLTDSLGKALGDKPFFQALAQKISAEARQTLPDSLPVGIKHGDFALRNLLISPNGCVTGLDTQARLRTSIYEDISYFLVSLTTTWPQVLSQGLVFDSVLLKQYENEFLSGYFEEDPVPHELIRLYKIKMLLDKWHARAFYGGQPISRRRFGPQRLGKFLTHRFFRSNTKRLLDASASAE